MPQASTRTEHLAQWASALQFADIPDDAVQRTKDFFLDWLGCAVAGRHHPAVAAIARFASQMGPTTGKSELVDGSLNLATSPAFASMINGASSHVVEQDDLHMSSITHPVSNDMSLNMAHVLMTPGHRHIPRGSGSGPRGGCQR